MLPEQQIEEVLIKYLSIERHLLIHNQQKGFVGGSPGLVVIGGDSCTERCGFESQHRILDGHFA